ncbi:copper resistance CopC family protein [Micromonospora sagamiensis]|uniref:Copper transport protein n=1 Tax=Micromonospora sagamiensis TaxID=47875 RepID=A0A562WCI6_9ACTN|nr:copper resistance CopC family protein [Micromonospora sagamiensis]TWJ27858.1 copper transport protein [Micromonospora sagamiensis]BCL13252.1 copper resistance protein C [Micromonospora sagamiensis]
MPRWSGPAGLVIRQVGAAVAAVAVVLTVSATPASAHARLVTTSPAEGSTISTPLETVEFTFDDRVRERFVTIVVAGPEGRSYLRGAVEVDQFRLRQPVYPTGSGSYRVAWRVVGSDGHPVQGEFRFQVALPPGQEPAVLPPAETEKDGTSRSGTPWPLVAGGGLVLLAVGVALASRTRGPRRWTGKLPR